jgi:SAM-dependent methyltransferase
MLAALQVETDPAEGGTMPESPPTSYDEIPYEGWPIEVTHPDHLGAVAALLGLRPAPPDRCRVLELGCTDGANLLAMALTLPDSRFVGIDLGSRQIAHGQSVVRDLGLTNVELRAASILDVDDSFGQFDYLICHGVYSWVPAEVREHILSVCRRNLAPQGVAYVSYNTYPGWHMWAVVRDLARFHAERFDGAAERTRQVRAFLDLTARSLTGSDQVYHRPLRERVEDLGQHGDAYLFHEYLEDVNEPVYFRQFARRAAAHGLQYLDEVSPTPLPSALGGEVLSAVEAMPADPIDREQYLDFLRGRSFRRTLLCLAGVPLSRPPSAQALAGLCLSALAFPAAERPDVESATVEEFRTMDRKSGATDDPVLKTALTYLAGVWPQTVAFADLWARVEARLGQAPEPARSSLGQGPAWVAEGLLGCYLGGLLDVHLQGRRFAAAPGERPVGSPLARLQAANSSVVANLCHRPVELGQLERAVLRQLDGTRDRAALIEPLETLVGQGLLGIRAEGRPLQEPAQVRRVLETVVPRCLEGLAAKALLVG